MPDATHRSIQSAFLKDLDLDAIRAIAACVVYCHIEAHEFSTGHFGRFGSEANVSGILRWMRTTSILEHLIRLRFPKYSTKLVPNSTNGHKHIEIAHGRFNLIVVHHPDSDPNAFVLTSEYGRTMALSNQFELFESADEKKGCDPADSYVAILFTCKAGFGEPPKLLQVRFPSSDLDYADEHLDLYKLLPELVDNDQVHSIVDGLYNPIVPEEEIPDQSHPKELKDDDQAETA